MTQYRILLRGINVGGRNKIQMKDLRASLSALNLKNIQTYIQSGNIFLESEDSSLLVEETIRTCLQKKFQISVPVFLYTEQKWKKIIEENPLSRYADNPLYGKYLNITFLKENLTQEEKLKIEKYKSEGEDFVVGDLCFYGWYGNGFGRSKMAETISKIRNGTTRNWNTLIHMNTIESL